MKKNLLSLLLLLGIGQVSAQSYYVINKTGTTSEYGLNGTGSVIIMAAPVNNVLSAPQNLPFTWKFYGNDVTSYKISENGYITFDLSSTTSYGINTTLPDTANPNNAIYAFWDEMEFKTYNTFHSGVRTWTYGTAGNRVHVIQWSLANPTGLLNTQNFNYFAIRIYEKGDFDVVHNYGYGTFNGTTGVENADGTDATIITGSPNLPFGGKSGSYDAAASKVYEFHYGTQAENDVDLNTETIKNIVGKSDNTIISGTLTNMGSKTLNSVTLTYSVDGGTPVSQTFNNLTVSPSGGIYSFAFSTPWTNATPGQSHSIKINVVNVNGSADENASKNELMASVFVNNGTAAEKRILLEEGSGAWCVWCPDGHVKLKEILQDNDNVYGIVHHNGGGTNDRMTNVESDKINTAFATGYPYGVINRALMPGSETVGLGRFDWSANIIEASNVKSPATVRITKKYYDSETRKITFTVTADFVDYAAGDIRIGAMVIEDNVRGNGAGWDQKITTNLTNDPDHPFYDYPTNMVGYIHNHVVTSIPSGAWGTAGVIPSTVNPGQSFSKEYTYTLPNTTKVTIPETSRFEPKGLIDGRYKPEDIKLLGFVAYYDANDLSGREIINSWETPLFGWGTGVKENKTDAVNNSTLYPNPVKEIGSVNFELTEKTQVKVEIYNAIGQKVQDVVSGAYTQGNHTIMFDATTLENGIYFLNINTSNGQVITKRFAVVK